MNATLWSLLEQWRTADEFDQGLELIIADAAEEAGYLECDKLRGRIVAAYPGGEYDPNESLVRLEMEKLRRWCRVQSGLPKPTYPL